jgi:RHS repeat-associated protein
VYVNPYLVLTSGGYTKHYSIEGQRIVSKLGGGWDNNGKGPLKAGGNKVDFATRAQQVFDGIVKNLKFLGDDGQILTAGKSGKVPPGQVNGTGNVTEVFRYFFHPDHLGSTRYVTDGSGEVYQHLEYFAFGEILVHEHSNTDRTPYLFNGKELDEETGLYYFGTRYYDPKTSIWQSVDPLAEDLPGLSPYNYCLNNPVVHNDPEGKIPPLIIAWAVVEIGLAVYDAYETYQTLKDKEASGAEKTVAVLATVGGAFLPGGGYGTAGKKITKEVVETVTEKAVKETIQKGAKESAQVGLQQSGKKPIKHHLATNKNNVSTARGGPWTPRFKKFFEGAGLNINKSPENIVELMEHHGPHPEAYHKYIFDNLATATKGLRSGTKQYKEAVVKTLNKLAKEAKTKGTKINKLLIE